MASASILHPDRFTNGGALIIPSRLSTADFALVMELCAGRRVMLLVEPETSYEASLRAALSASGAARLQRTSEDAMVSISSAVAAGVIVIYAPPAVTARRATNIHIPREIMELLGMVRTPVQCIGVDHPREHCLAIESPNDHPESVISVAPLINAPDLSSVRIQADLMEAAADAYAIRSTFKGHLGRLLISGLKMHGKSTSIVDGLDGSITSYSDIFAAAATLAGEIKRCTKKDRVGIVMPPGRGGLIANIAAIFAGKTPVNLNYTAGKEALESAIKQSGVDRFITADVIVRKMQTFPWPSIRDIIFIERVLPQKKAALVAWALAIKFLSAGTLATLLGVPAEGGDKECSLLFTSGSSGEPKGVALSHRNLIANIIQFGARIDISVTSKILGCLPLFHSFGSTVTLWFPLINGTGLVTYPTPLEPPKLAELVEKHNVDIMLATPTFLRGYLKRVKVEQLASLRLIVTGAEKLPLKLEEEFRKKFEKPVMEGYGLTETSPVSNVNLPDPPAEGTAPLLTSRRLGSAGQFLPGVAVRISDPVTDGMLPIDQSGMIWLKGPNIFPGYLNQPRKTEEVIREGWFRTGDIGRVDADGFLFIEGRLSRFSKIAGEMVPHETVEDHINRAFGLDGETERRIAIVGMPDADKGEALVLLSTVAGDAIKQEIIQLRYNLIERGVPALWIPKRLVKVEHIPILASGKLDIKGCEKLAIAGLANSN